MTEKQIYVFPDFRIIYLIFFQVIYLFLEDHWIINFSETFQKLIFSRIPERE